jgi:hypothetical protein
MVMDKEFEDGLESNMLTAEGILEHALCIADFMEMKEHRARQ